MGGASPAIRGSRPGWILPAVAAVVLLAIVIGVVAGIALNARQTGGSASAAAGYVPADATMYAEFRLDLPGDQRANFETFLGHFPDDAASTLLTAKLDELLDGPAADPSGMRYTTDVKPWFDGTAAVAMVGYPSMDPANPLASMPKMLVMLGVKDQAAATAAVDRVRTESGMSGITSTTHAGATIWSVDASGSGVPYQFSWTVTADQVLMGTGTDLIAQALDVHGGSGASLASRQEFRDGLSRLPADRVATVSIDSAQILEEMRTSLASAAPGASGIADLLDGKGPTFVVGSARFEGDRLVMDETSTLPSGTELQNRDSGLASAVPGDALFFAESHDVGKGAAAAIDAVMQTLGTSLGSDQVGQIESALGTDLSSFVSWMGDSALVVGKGGDGNPYVGLVVTPTDADQASLRLNQLQGLLQLGSSSGGPSVNVSDADHNGTRITTIAFGDVPAAMSWAASVQYAVTDDRVIIGTGTSFVSRVLDMSAADSLAGQSRFKAARDAVGGASNTSLFWIDLAGIRAAVEPVLPADARSTYDAQVSKWLAPIDYLAAASRVDGSRLEGRSVLVVK